MDDSATADAVRRLAAREVVAVGIASGLLGALALAVPVVLWDWARDGHRAFEYAMAPTAWLFGLQHFSNAHYHWWSLVFGIALLGLATGASYAVLRASPARVEAKGGRRHTRSLVERAA